MSTGKDHLIRHVFFVETATAYLFIGPEGKWFAAELKHFPKQHAEAPNITGSWKLTKAYCLEKNKRGIPQESRLSYEDSHHESTFDDLLIQHFTEIDPLIKWLLFRTFDRLRPTDNIRYLTRLSDGYWLLTCRFIPQGHNWRDSLKLKVDPRQVKGVA